jgi:hypothetical protein
MVTISATASDDVGVSSVEFLQDDVLVATDDAAPFSYRWEIDVNDNGASSWTARASDAAGNSTTSASLDLSVSIASGGGIVDTTPPEVQIDTPLNGTTYTTAGPISVAATATDNEGVVKVEFYRNGALRTIDTVPPFGFSTELTVASNGSYALEARAYDDYGNAATSSPVNVTVDITPSGGPDPESGTWNLTSDSLAFDGITDFTITIDGNRQVTDLSYVFNGIARSFSGSDITRSAVDVDLDNNVNISIDWRGDNGLDLDEGILNDARNVVTGLLDYHIWDNDDLEAGFDGATLAREDVGGSADTTAPSVTITSPADGTLITSRESVTVVADAADDVGVTKVEFYRNGVLRSIDAVAPYEWTRELSSVSNGDYSLTARAYDAAGNVTTSSAVNLTINIPSSGGSGAPLEGIWTFDSITLAVNGVTDLKITVDSNLNVTDISYNLKGSPRNFSAAFIDSGAMDLDANGDFDIEVEWDDCTTCLGSDNSITFGGGLNSNQDVATGTIIFSFVEDDPDIIVVVGEGSATVLKQ